MSRFPWLWLGLLTVALGARAAAPDRALLDAEQTYELRLQRVMQQHGLAGLAERVKHDYATDPLPYVKAWYANYLLYGDEFGLKGFADPKRGFMMAQDARSGGSLIGLELVGRAFGDGRGVARNPAAAVYCLTQAAAAGRGSAMGELSKYYFFGYGVPKDRAKAIAYARQAGWLGVTDGLMHLAAWLLNPKMAGAADPAMSLELYHEAAVDGDVAGRRRVAMLARQGDPDAERYLKLDYVVGASEGAVARPARLQATVKWLEAHSPADDWEVRLPIAELQIERRSPLYDLPAATAALKRAAAAGQRDADAILADMTFRGIGRKSDPAAAIAAWRKLAAQGNARALNALGSLAWWGDGAKYGVKKDPAEAFALCHRAADLGYWAALFNTAECYVDGIGTEKNYVLAAKYYLLLQLRGYFRAGPLEDKVLAMIHD